MTGVIRSSWIWRGNIVSIDFEGEVLGQEELMFQTIAPFVKLVPTFT